MVNCAQLMQDLRATDPFRASPRVLAAAPKRCLSYAQGQQGNEVEADLGTGEDVGTTEVADVHVRAVETARLWVTSPATPGPHPTRGRRRVTPRCTEYSRESLRW
jgi:hypothetical protein